jgi:hypothetical protein
MRRIRQYQWLIVVLLHLKKPFQTKQNIFKFLVMILWWILTSKSGWSK